MPVTMTAKRQKLIRIVNSLPDDKTLMALDFFRLIQDEDDEPLTDDELAQIEKAKADIAAGHFYTLKEFNNRMDALP